MRSRSCFLPGRFPGVVPLAFTVLLFSSAAFLLRAAEDPVKKPVEPKPKPFRELKEDPAYKKAEIYDRPHSPMPSGEGQKPEEKKRWEEHKRAMHYMAAKRTPENNPDLRSVVEWLKDVGGADRSQSAFEDVAMPGGTELTVFRPSNLDAFLNTGEDEAQRTAALQAAIALGKAFFWDPAFSSDGAISCGTCHYAAGTDHRIDGVVGLPANLGLRIPFPDMRKPDHRNRYTPYKLDASDLAGNVETPRPNDGKGVFDPVSMVGFKTGKIIGSLGIQRRIFSGVRDGGGENWVSFPETNVDTFLPVDVMNAITRVEGVYHQITPRNAGTVINAVFNTRNFHDSRASMIFNGQTSAGVYEDENGNLGGPFIYRSGTAGVEQVSTWSPFRIWIDGQGRRNEEKNNINPYYITNAALASQAVEPVISDREMSHAGRRFHHIARRTLGREILTGRAIAEDDSSLSPYAASRVEYGQLIRTAFRKEWWDDMAKVKLPKISYVHTGESTTDGATGDMKDRQRTGTPLSPEELESLPVSMKDDYTLMEANFGLFWGLALQLYQSTLVSDDSRFDQVQRALGSAPSAPPAPRFTAQEQRGWELFARHGCNECHMGAEFAGGSITEIGLIPPWVWADEEMTTKRPTVDPYLSKEDVEDDFAVEEDEPLDGPLDPVDATPYGIEALAVSGRMLAFYDAGNYVVGASRYADGTAGEAWTELRMEDSGIGNRFIPPGYSSLAKELPVGYQSPFGVAFKQFGNYLKNGTRGQELVEILGEGKKGQNYLARTDFMMHRQVKLRELTGLIPQVDGVQVDGVQSAVLPRTALNSTQIPEIALGLAESQIEKMLLKREKPVPVLNEIPDYSMARRWVGRIDETIGEAVKNAAAATGGRKVYWNRQVAGLRKLKANKERISDAAAFRAPTLRNIELTGPYMHNGSLLTLEAVIEFYAAGGHFGQRPAAGKPDPLPFATGDMHPEMLPLPLSPADKAALVAFLKTLTDERIVLEKAPFDRPEFLLPSSADTLVASEPGATDGAPPAESAKLPSGKPAFIKFPAVGKNGSGGRWITSYEDILKNPTIKGVPGAQSY
ncbi:MAG: hypothetical protein KF712_21115 [Akkermansiaceae bacterium]|nr:hypothetical protein [Akkermansiaceae bacterium]